MGPKEKRKKDAERREAAALEDLKTLLRDPKTFKIVENLPDLLKMGVRIFSQLFEPRADEQSGASDDQHLAPAENHSGRVATPDERPVRGA